jgi:hypothetical protein
VGRLVTALATPTGSRVDFCLFTADGLYGLRESGPLDVRSFLSTLPQDACADDVHRAIAPDRPVPPELVDACAQARGSTALVIGDDGVTADDLEDEGSVTVTRPGLGVLDPPPVSYAHYCAGDGPQDFQDERCSLMEGATGWDGWYDTMWWCHTPASDWMQRTASAQIGHKVNKLEVVLAACSGTTSVALKAKVAGSWNTYIDDSLHANYWGSWYVESTLWTSDYDMRVNADSESGWFRDTGFFGDFVWP